MPDPTEDGLRSLLGTAKLEVEKASELDRGGEKLVVARGRIVSAKGPGLDVSLLVVPAKGGGAVALISYIRADQDPIVRQANDAILASARRIGPRMPVSAEPPTAGLIGAPKDLVTSMAKMIGGIDARLRLPRPLAIRFVNCGKVNAFYKPGEHSVTMCHELFDAAVRDFAAAGKPKAEALASARGFFVTVFFHEFGHALAGELKLPITGKGEDAADELAAIFLAAADGKKAVIAAAEYFHLKSKSRPQTMYWDEHSLDAQRAVGFVCLLYGTDRGYGKVLKLLGADDRRLAKCTRDYEARRDAWNQLLAPHARPPLLR